MEQTNRTILFEQINGNMNNIFTYINIENQENLSDQCINEIHNALLVSSFEECMQKFAPSVYLCIDYEKEENFCTASIEQARDFSFGKGTEVNQIVFNEKNLLLGYFTHMLDGDISTDIENYLASNIVALLVPEINENDFFMDFSRIVNVYIKGDYAQSNNLFHQFTQKYNNGLFLIKMLLQLINKELNMPEAQRKMRHICIDDGKDNWQVCISAIAPNYKKKYSYLTPQLVAGYEEWIAEETKDIQNGELYRKVFQVLILVATQKMDELENLYFRNLNYYIDIIENFWKCSKPIIEKLLGIKAYFAQSKEDDEVGVQLLITNVEIESISNNKNRKMLEIFFRTVNGKLYNKNTIWYAIIPRLPYTDEMRKENIRERFSGNKHTYLSETQNLAVYPELVRILAENKIQIFCSSISTEHTSVEWVYEKGVDEWIKYQEGLIIKDFVDYIYPCFPNFSLFLDPYMEMQVDLRKEGCLWNERKTNTNKIGRQELWLKMPYVEASYVAAGMYAAFQNTQYLKKYFPNRIDETIPGIGFRVLVDNNNLKVPCTLKAGVFLYSNEIMDDISRKVCGIFFASYGSRIIIVQDRALAGLFGRNNCVSQIQTMTYLERMICSETQDFKSNLIEHFFQRRPNSLSAKWNQDRSSLNSILKNKEELVYRLDKEKKECVFELVFSNTKCQTSVHTN